MRLLERVMEELSKKPMSVSELSKRLNMRRDFLTGYLEALRQQGYVEKIVVGRAHVYLPTDRVMIAKGGLYEEEE